MEADELYMNANAQLQRKYHVVYDSCSEISIHTHMIPTSLDKDHTSMMMDEDEENRPNIVKIPTPPCHRAVAG